MYIPSVTAKQIRIPLARFSLNRASPQAANLVGWWPPLAGRGGATLRDLRGTNSAPFPGGANDPGWVTDAQLGAALDFDGSTDYVAIPDDPRLDITGSLTLAAWAKFKSDPGTGSFPRIVIKDGSPTWSKPPYQILYHGTNGWLTAGISDGATNKLPVYTLSNPASQGWLHIVMVFDDANGTINIYQNGVLMKEDNSVTISPYASTGDLVLGAANGGASQPFDGQIGDVRLYNRPLSAAEVKHLYNPATRWDLYRPLSPPVAIAGLEAAQKSLSNTPAVTLSIGGHTLDSYVVAYTYREVGDSDGGLSIYLDNREGNFDDLATDWPGLTRGAVVDLRRGLRYPGGGTILEKLPRCWVEALEYVHDGDYEGMLLLECLDWRGLLDVLSYETYTSFTSQTVQAIVTSVLSQAGLTLAAGSFDTALTIDHEASPYDTLAEVVEDLMAKVEDELYTGLDGEISYKVLDPAEGAGYAYDWNIFDGSAHPLLEGTEIVESSPVYNKVTVVGGSELQYSGSAQDATEIAALGQTRHRYIEDKSLGSNADCTTAATAELQFWQARAVAALVVARPHFTLRMYDVVSVAAPAWGGPAVSAGRVTAITERYGLGDWEQEIEIGEIPEGVLLAAEGTSPGARKRTKGKKRRSSRRRSSRKAKARKRSGSRRKAGSYRRKLQRGRGLRDSTRRPSYRGHAHTSDQVAGAVPIGAIIMWSGAAVPAGWALCDGASGTPDLRDKFIVAAGSTYSAGSSGGAATIDLQHSHAPGTLATDSDNHSHTDGSLTTASAGSHSHSGGTLTTDSDGHSHNLSGSTASGGSHSHGAGTLDADGTHNVGGTGGPSAGTGADDHDHTVSGSTASGGSHSHSLGSVSTDSDSHSHGVSSGSTASGGSHSHTVSGSTASDSHSHAVDSGSTGNALSTAQDILPPYYAVAFIMRIS